MKAGRTLLPLAAVLLIAPASAIATLNLAQAPGSIRVDGGAAGDLLGYSIASAGDVNGDGQPDLIVGARDAGNNGRPNSGSAYVVYGGTSLASLDLRSLGSAQGFRIDGAAQGDRAGYSVAGAGDVNGDGYADVIVGAPNTDDAASNDPSCASLGNACNSGSVYILYGRQAPTNIDLAAVKTGGAQADRGIEIDGAAAGNQAGYSVAGLGNVNGDQNPANNKALDDVIFGALGPDTSPGAAYVIYGQTGDPTDINLATDNLATTPPRGIEIDGAAAGDGTGEAVAGPGDVNGDNHPDLLVSAPDASNGAGRVYVIYGSGQNLASIDLSQQSLGSRGFRIDGANPGDNLGESSNSVAGAGDDVNGDNIHDVIVGARFADNNGRTDSGSAYVIYGQNAADPGNVALANINSTQAGRGMEIDGAAAGDNAGTAVAGVGDLNGDGVPDLLVGARFVSNNGGNSGSAYAIYGQAGDPQNLDLATITTTNDARGSRIDGAAQDDRAGRAVAGGADLNGVKGRDVLVGAPYANNNGRTDSGSGYVLPDVVAPNTIIDTGPTGTITTPRATFTFHATESASFKCSIDQGNPSYAACSSPYTSRKLRNGTYTFRVYATDAHGNVDPTPATRAFTVHH